MSAVAERQSNPVAEVRVQLEGMSDQFQAALPKHIPAERFKRVVMTAVQNNPDLLKAERRSLWNSAMKAAQDGLLPDGREGAMVVYGSQIQWMPMIAGIRKKVRNSGEIATWDAHVVHENDAFEFELGDEPFIRHKPSLDDPGKVIAAYSIATLKSGEKTREVMSIDAIEKVRKRSKAATKGPWVTDYEEMCRKTVARRHSKVLPMSTDLDDLIRRDDDLYDFKETGEKQAAAEPAKPRNLAGRLNAISAPLPAHDEETGEILEDEAPRGAAAAVIDADAPTTDETDQADDGPDYDTLLSELRQAFANATTEEELLTISDKASAAWFNDAPKAIREKGADIFEARRKEIMAPKRTEKPKQQEAAKPAPKAEGIADPDLKSLYSEGMEQARKGSTKLKFWIGKLSAPDYDKVESYLDEMRDTAKQFD